MDYVVGLLCFLQLSQNIKLGRAMVMGSFQCRGVLLLWHVVGQGPGARFTKLFMTELIHKT